jgi:hypothetical protein
MVYYEINKKNYASLISELNKYLTKKDCQVFMLIYMEGCPPCSETRPEWAKLKNVLSDNIIDGGEIVIVSIDKDLFGKLKNMKSEPNSFPTIRYIKDAGEKVETYEDSNISNKNRSIDSFIEWIKSKTGEDAITKSEIKVANQPHKSHHTKYHKRHNKRHHTKKRHSRNKQKGGKWSLKYKRSINCNRPRGFSQKQYCKYSAKKR